MGKTRCIIFLVIITFSLGGCKNDRNIFDGTFRQVSFKGDTLVLNGEKVNLEIPGVMDFEIVDTFLVAFTPMNNDGFISVYNANSYKLLYKNLIRRGRGPNEFTSWVNLCNKHYVDTTGAIIWLDDNNNQFLLAVNLTKSVRQQELIIEKSVDLTDISKNNTKEIQLLTDTTYLILDYSQMEKLNGKFIWSVDNYILNLYNSVSKNNVFSKQLYTQKATNVNFLAGSTSVKPDNSRLVITMTSFDQINFMSLDGKEKFSVSIRKKPMKMESLTENDNERIQYYTSVYFNDNLIIAVYAKESRIDAGKAGTEIHVFNWEGDLLNIIKTVQYIPSITVDEKKGYLYGLDLITEEIYRYDIRQILNQTKIK